MNPPKIPNKKLSTLCPPFTLHAWLRSVFVKFGSLVHQPPNALHPYLLALIAEDAALYFNTFGIVQHRMEGSDMKSAPTYCDYAFDPFWGGAHNKESGHYCPRPLRSGRRGVLQILISLLFNILSAPTWSRYNAQSSWLVNMLEPLF
jgi:hypothetical protein